MEDETSGSWSFNGEDETITNTGAFIENLKRVGQLLQSNYLQNLIMSCQDKDDNIRQLRIANVNLRNEVNGLKSSQQSFQKRSDEYKEKFQNAQIVIEELHQKNIKLLKSIDGLTQKIASQQVAAQHDTGHPLFEKPRISEKPEKVVVLAPDTCQVDTHPVFDIEDDEDLIHDECKDDEDGVKDLENSVDNFENENSVNEFENDETMFIKPPPLDSEIADECTIDMDETHFDDIPSSPVLKQKKHSRFLTPKIPKKVENLCATSEGKRSAATTTPLKDISMFLNSSTEASPSVLPSSSKSFKSSAPKKSPDDTFETSLNDLFDKTDGNLDTTAANLEETYQKSQHSKSKSEIDFDLDNDDFMPSKHDRINKNATVKKYEKVIQIEKSPHSDKENDSAFCKGKSKGNKKVSPKRKTIASPRTLWMSDFDKLPKREKPNFKHKTVVKNRDKRLNLDGKTCAQCEAFYSDLSADKRKEMLRKVCKHKFVYQPPSTPEHYWDVDIPSTSECRERGYMIDKSDSTKREKFRRRKR